MAVSLAQIGVARNACHNRSDRSPGKTPGTTVAHDVMTNDEQPDLESGHLLRNVAFVRLWATGGFTNATRWLEILVSGLVTFEATQSALAVAGVTMMRSLPMLLTGALTGAVAEALDRKRLLMIGQMINLAGVVVLGILSASGTLQVWHLAIASLTSGLVWAGDMAVRRRMIGEAAGEGHIARAIALDSMTNSVTRMIGPILGGLAFEGLGVTGAYLVAMLGYAASAVAAVGLAHRQVVQPLSLRGLPSAIAEATAFVRRMPVLRSVLIVTTLVNVFGFSYITVLPAWGELRFGATPTMIGMLAGAEPFGALIGAWILATRELRIAASTLFTTGAIGFLIMLGIAANLPSLALAWVLLALGGLGTAAFGSMQTTLVILNVPIEARSRVLGLVSTCIGMGPAGVLAAGALTDRFGPVIALTTMSIIGAALMIVSRQKDPPANSA